MLFAENICTSMYSTYYLYAVRCCLIFIHGSVRGIRPNQVHRRENTCVSVVDLCVVVCIEECHRKKE